MALKNQSNLLYGLKVYNHEEKTVGLVIYTWDNIFWSSDGPVNVPFATCVNNKGNKYNTPLENIQPIEEMDDEELKEFGLINS